MSKDKSMDIDKERTSIFIKDELHNLDSLLDGSYCLNKFDKDSQIDTFQSKISNSRKDKLLGSKKEVENIQSNLGDKNATDVIEMRKIKFMLENQPKNDEDYKKLLIQWVRNFHLNHLLIDDKITKVQKLMFEVGNS